MAAIGGAVSVMSALAPKQFLAIFGVAEQDTGAGRLAWRLFAARTAAISLLAACNDETAKRIFLPVQFMDQAAWWWGYKRGELPLRTAGLAAAASGAIIALDIRRRFG
jgi:predicted anti-sigma-YlaC factor YlaD